MRSSSFAASVGSPHPAIEHHVALFFAATGGGVQRVQTTLANGFAARGLRVACVMPQAIGPFVGDLVPEVTLVDLETRRPLEVVRRLRRHLRSHRPGLLLIAAQQHTILAAIAACKVSGMGVPLVIVQHNTLSEVCQHSRYFAMRSLLPSAARLLFPLADMICAVSRGVADDLECYLGLQRERITVIYNPVVGSDVAERSARPSNHLWLDTKDRPVLLGVGSLIENKGFAGLIRAFAQLRRNLDVRLIILGEGDQRGPLISLASELGVLDDIDLPGFVDNPMAFMAKADLLALSSRVEGLPTVIIEALACGCPVVSTNCPHGPAELLEGGTLGRLVPIDDDVAMAAALLDTLRCRPDPARLKARASAFTVDEAVDRYLALVPPAVLADVYEGRRMRSEGLNPGP